MSNEEKRMKRSYRLPDGRHTTSGKKLSKTWKALSDPICLATGAEVVGYDPGIQFVYGHDAFTLPVSFIEKLNKAINLDHLV